MRAGRHCFAVLPPVLACVLVLASGAAHSVSPNYYVSEDGHAADFSGSKMSGAGFAAQTPADRVYSFHSRTPARPRPEGVLSPVKAVFSPIESALGRAGDGGVATTVNTDYKTRPASAPIPQFVRGRGINGRNLPIGGEDEFRKTMPADYTPTDLVLLPRDMCYYRMPIWLREEAAQALVRMIEDARREGLTLLVFSGYRDYRHQARLRRGGGNVARAGASEHQLGTTVDLTNSERHLMRRSLASTPEGRWLSRNAGRYGFVATVKRGDVVVEPWHLRYFGSGRREREAAPGFYVASATDPRQPARTGARRSRAVAPVTTATASRVASATVRPVQTVATERTVARAPDRSIAADARDWQPAASVYQPAAPLPEPPSSRFSLRRLLNRE